MPHLLDLRRCQTLILNLPADVTRRDSTTALCDSLGLDWRLVEAVKCDPGRIGCGLSHLKALRQVQGALPATILEDDVAVTDDYAPVVEIPDDADALYLGCSAFGAIEMIEYVGFTGRLLAEPAAPGLLRVYNLLGAHAIVYLSERYRAAAAEAIVHSIADRDWDPDRGLAAIHADFNIYALERPAFYQAGALQTSENRAQMQEAATRVVLEPLPVGSVEPIFLGEEARSIRIERQDGRLKWVWA